MNLHKIVLTIWRFFPLRIRNGHQRQTVEGAEKYVGPGTEGGIGHVQGGHGLVQEFVLGQHNRVKVVDVDDVEGVGLPLCNLLKSGEIYSLKALNRRDMISET